jgi:L-amino acid N-acyltransferase
VRIRDAVDGDVPSITSLSNALIATTTVAWTEHEEDVEARADWFRRQQRDGHPVLVAEVDGAVVGYASYGDFRDSAKWPGYRFTVEHSVHVDGAHHGKGIGLALMEALLTRAAGAGKHTMVAAIDAENEGSIQFHRTLGFVEVARMPEVGRKFDRWLDLVLLQRSLGPDEPTDGGMPRV